MSRIPGELADLQCAGNDDLQLFIVDGLGDVVVGAFLHGLDGRFNGAVSGHDKDRHIGHLLPGCFQHIHARDGAQLEIRDDHVEGFVFLDHAEGFVPRAGQEQLIPGGFQHQLEEPAHSFFIFDDQEGGCVHGLATG